MKCAYSRERPPALAEYFHFVVVVVAVAGTAVASSCPSFVASVAPSSFASVSALQDETTCSSGCAR